MNKRTTGWLFILLLVLLATLAACAGNTAPADGNQNGGDETADRGAIRVTAKEFSFALDKSEATAGAVTFVVENKGSATHDFAVEHNGVEERTPKIQPGEDATFTVDRARDVHLSLHHLPTRTVRDAGHVYGDRKLKPVAPQ